MRLNDAMLCINCDTVHAEKHCPACGSWVMYPIAKWLNRKPAEVPFELTEIHELERLYKLERRWD